MPGSAFQCQVNALYDPGVKPSACHQHEVPPAHKSQADGSQSPSGDHCQDSLGGRLQTNFRGEHIGGSQRQEGQRHLGFGDGQAVDDLVDGTIAACHNDQVEAMGTGRPSRLFGISALAGADQLRAAPQPGQPLKNRLQATAWGTRSRIENNQRPSETTDRILRRRAKHALYCPSPQTIDVNPMLIKYNGIMNAPMSHIINLTITRILRK